MDKGYIRIVSRRAGGKRAHPGETIIRVDRSNPLLGNRHYLSNPNDLAERDKVIALNRADVEADVACCGPIFRFLRDDIAVRVENGERLAFECFCAPKRCHAENHRDVVSHLVGRDVRPPDELEAPAQQPAAQGSLF